MGHTETDGDPGDASGWLCGDLHLFGAHRLLGTLGTRMTGDVGGLESGRSVWVAPDMCALMSV